MVVITHLWRSTGREGAQYVQGSARNSFVFPLYAGCRRVRYHIIASLALFLFILSLHVWLPGTRLSDKETNEISWMSFTTSLPGNDSLCTELGFLIRKLSVCVNVLAFVS